jgi:hypothetical protein
MPFLFFSGWHSVITAKRSIFFDKSDMTIAEEVSHSANTAPIGAVYLVAQLTQHQLEQFQGQYEHQQPARARTLCALP